MALNGAVGRPGGDHEDEDGGESDDGDSGGGDSDDGDNYGGDSGGNCVLHCTGHTGRTLWLVNEALSI